MQAVRKTSVMTRSAEQTAMMTRLWKVCCSCTWVSTIDSREQPPAPEQSASDGDSQGGGGGGGTDHRGGGGPQEGSRPHRASSSSNMSSGSSITSGTWNMLSIYTGNIYSFNEKRATFFYRIFRIFIQSMF